VTWSLSSEKAPVEKLSHENSVFPIHIQSANLKCYRKMPPERKYPVIPDCDKNITSVSKMP